MRLVDTKIIEGCLVELSENDGFFSSDQNYQLEVRVIGGDNNHTDKIKGSYMLARCAFDGFDKHAADHIKKRYLNRLNKTSY